VSLERNAAPGRLPGRGAPFQAVCPLSIVAFAIRSRTFYPSQRAMLRPSHVEAIYPLAQAIVDRTPAGMFDAPVDVGADAPLIDRLVALTGRRPA
jgi:hypothetical protein